MLGICSSKWFFSVLHISTLEQNIFRTIQCLEFKELSIVYKVLPSSACVSFQGHFIMLNVSLLHQLFSEPSFFYYCVRFTIITGGSYFELQFFAVVLYHFTQFCIVRSLHLSGPLQTNQFSIFMCKMSRGEGTFESRMDGMSYTGQKRESGLLLFLPGSENCVKNIILPFCLF